MIFSYARFSTQSQNEDRQLDELKNYGVPEVRLYVEKISGTTKERLTIIDHLERQGMKVISIKKQIDTRTLIDMPLMTILIALSHFERDIIIQHTQEGLTAAKACVRKRWAISTLASSYTL